MWLSHETGRWWVKKKKRNITKRNGREKADGPKMDRISSDFERRICIFICDRGGGCGKTSEKRRRGKSTITDRQSEFPNPRSDDVKPKPRTMGKYAGLNLCRRRWILIPGETGFIDFVLIELYNKLLLLTNLYVHHLMLRLSNTKLSQTIY